MGCFKVVMKINRKNNVGHCSGPYIATVSVTSTTTLQHVSSDTACKDADYWPLLSLQRDLGCWSNLTVGAAAWRVAKAIMAKDFGKWGKMSGMRPAIFRIKPAAHVITAGVELVYRTKNSSFFLKHCPLWAPILRTWSALGALVRVNRSILSGLQLRIHKQSRRRREPVCVCRCKQGSKHYAYYRGRNN